MSGLAPERPTLGQVLPRAHLAVCDPHKVSGYLLSRDHPKGRHKAKVFRSALGFGPEHAEVLRAALLAGVAVFPVTNVRSGAGLHMWQAEVRMEIDGASEMRAAVVSAWESTLAPKPPRPLTAMVKGSAWVPTGSDIGDYRGIR